MRLNPDVRKHYLKIWPEFYKPVKQRKKTFDIRFNDRNYKVGDICIFQEWDPKKEEYTGSPDIITHVPYVLSGTPWLPEGYVCMSIRVLGQPYAEDVPEGVELP